MRAVFDIAYHGGGEGVQINHIARRRGISPRDLEQIFQKLRNAGVITSKGGYALAKGPGDIRVGEIIWVTEGGLEPVFCVHPEKSAKDCDHIAECVTRLIWKEAGEALEDFFDSVTIRDLCEKAERPGVHKEKGRLMYYI